jgi:hypothetical protein
MAKILTKVWLKSNAAHHARKTTLLEQQCGARAWQENIPERQCSPPCVEKQHYLNSNAAHVHGKNTYLNGNAATTGVSWYRTIKNNKTTKSSENNIKKVHGTCPAHKEHTGSVAMHALNCNITQCTLHSYKHAATHTCPQPTPVSICLMIMPTMELHSPPGPQVPELELIRAPHARRHQHATGRHGQGTDTCRAD